MPITRISDVIVPELFEPYVIQRTMELSAMFSSGIVATNDTFNALASEAARTHNMPFFEDLTGDSEPTLEDVKMTAAKIGSNKDVSTTILRQKMWGASNLSAALAGKDPMMAIGDLAAGFWARDHQKELVAVLKGIFGSYDTSTGGTIGVYTITISTKGAIGDKITVDEVEYTIADDTSAASRTIAVGSTNSTQASALKTLLEEQYSGVFTVTVTSNVITLTQVVAGDGAQPTISVVQTTDGTLVAAAATTTAGVGNSVSPLANHILDISTEANASDQLICADAFIDGCQKLGDAQSTLTGVMMHSATKSYLKKRNLIETERDSTDVEFETYQGRRVIVDDGCPVSNGVYSTYLFGNGAFAYGNGSPEGHVAVEIDRDKQTGGGIDYLINRKAYILHPRGVAYTGAVREKVETPLRSELENARNWNKVYEDKQIRMVEIRHKIG
ncbi:hypothetical protein [[Clostridium] polysaccharolyticum]|uniref:Uncharacterized protein n=1 Tax=[Clostridium] polysaccharolyticum TaxID=29364 RepID=A0A1H9YID5_9FIRM|nr:hypothetical protein [[Clostridium] polysaccharolyticum]SES68740.1 hypothetical protein SAMN04487772_10234 [[Clostridium] polysaccharolyticum]